MIKKSEARRDYITFGQLNIITDSRFNWVRFNSWIRSYIISLVSGFGNLEQTSARLYRAPLDFYNLLLPIIGRENAEQVLNYFTIHIGTLEALANAIRTNDTNMVNAATARLYQNAERLAEFFAEINPYYSEEIWKNFLNKNIRMTIDQIFNLMAGNYELDIIIFDRILEQAILMGDYMSRGLFNFLLGNQR